MEPRMESQGNRATASNCKAHWLDDTEPAQTTWKNSLDFEFESNRIKQTQTWWRSSRESPKFAESCVVPELCNGEHYGALIA